MRLAINIRHLFTQAFDAGLAVKGAVQQVGDFTDFHFPRRNEFAQRGAIVGRIIFFIDQYQVTVKSGITQCYRCRAACRTGPEDHGGLRVLATDKRVAGRRKWARVHQHTVLLKHHRILLEVLQSQRFAPFAIGDIKRGFMPRADQFAIAHGALLQRPACVRAFTLKGANFRPGADKDH